MNLSELLFKLESYPANKVFKVGFRTPHSYRPRSNELAFSPVFNVKVASMLAYAKSALNASYSSCTGRVYTMSLLTPVHVAAQGCPAICDESMASLFRDAELLEFNDATALNAELARLREDTAILVHRLSGLEEAAKLSLKALLGVIHGEPCFGAPVKAAIESIKTSSAQLRPSPDTARDVGRLVAERDAYQQAADAMAWAHKVERDTLTNQVVELRAAARLALGAVSLVHRQGSHEMRFTGEDVRRCEKAIVALVTVLEHAQAHPQEPVLLSALAK